MSDDAKQKAGDLLTRLTEAMTEQAKTLRRIEESSRKAASHLFWIALPIYVAFVLAMVVVIFWIAMMFLMAGSGTPR